MDLFQGGILTGEKIKIKNKNANINPAVVDSNNISGSSESENQGSNGAVALKRRHSSTLFAPKHAGKEHIFIFFTI